MVLEYNEVASLLLQKLKNCPKGAIREFYSALEDEPDVTETGKLYFTDQWSRRFKSFGKPVADVAVWYDGL